MRKFLTLIGVLAIAIASTAVFTAAINAARGGEAPNFEASCSAVTANGEGGEGLKFETVLSGDQEVTTPVTGAAPGVITTAMGEIEARFDDGFTQVEVKLEVRDVPDTVTVTKAHFHCARAGENGPIAFGLFVPGPLNPGLPLDPGEEVDVEGTLTNADFTGTDCVPHIGRPVNNIAALAFAMRDGLIYANVHTDDNPGGEIRGQMLEE